MPFYMRVTNTNHVDYGLNVQGYNTVSFSGNVSSVVYGEDGHTSIGSITGSTTSIITISGNNIVYLHPSNQGDYVVTFLS